MHDLTFAGAAQFQRAGIKPRDLCVAVQRKAQHRAIALGRRLFVEGFRDGECKIRALPIGHAIRRHQLRDIALIKEGFVKFDRGRHIVRAQYQIVQFHNAYVFL